MPDDEAPKVTREGLLETLAGKTKEALGDLVGNQHLAEEGRVQQEDALAEGEAADHPGAATDAPSP
jgi:uncharacterized protein YjbJ (UPF0337 family)